MSLDTSTCMILSWVLYAIGLIGLLVRRNLVALLLVLMLLFNAASLGWVTAVRYYREPAQQLSALLLLAVLTAQFIVGLGIVFSWLRRRDSADIQSAHTLKN